MKILLKLPLLFIVIGMAGIAFRLITMFGGQFPRNLIANKPVEKPVQSIQGTTSPEQLSSGLPIRLKIPKINVDAALEYVGLTSNGAVGVPKGPTDAAWFDLGPRPGEEGNSVIVGHFGWKDGIPAVFDNLYKLHKGDKIYVEDKKGTILTFTVRESNIFGEDEDAIKVFDSSDGKAHLNLITCEGVWNKTRKSYSDRLVVFADKEAE